MGWFHLAVALLMIAVAFRQRSFSGPLSIAITHGLQVAAVAIVAQAVYAMRASLAPDAPRMSIAVLAAVIMFMVPSFFAGLLAIVAGAFLGQLLRRNETTTTKRAFISLPTGSVVCFVLALVLLFASLVVHQSGASLISVAAAFYKAGALTFGGGHVVLPLLDKAVVSTGWVTQQTFLSGYGVAQAIPGPLFSFAAFLGTTIPASAPPVLVGLTALISIFAPGLLLMAAALPSWNRLRESLMAQRALLGINASVVGILFAAFINPVSSSALHGAGDGVIALFGFFLLTILETTPVVVVLLTVAGYWLWMLPSLIRW